MNYTVKLQEELVKKNEFYWILVRWVRLLQKGGSVKDYFDKYGYVKVAIYGMAEIGELLFDEIEKHVQIKYVIDKNADRIFAPCVLRPDEALDDVDVIVVCAIHYYEEIAESLMQKTAAQIVSFEDVLFEAELMSDITPM